MRSILWKSDDGLSSEYFTLATHGDAFALDGTVILLLEGLPTRINYRVECDKDWRTRLVVVHQDRSDGIKHLALKADERQVWQTDASTIPHLMGIYDVDLEITPATNTLPIRRLSLKVGESRQVDAAWIRFPSLALERLCQRYTRIADRVYKYENPLTGFEAQLEVDEFGLVVSYDGLWQRFQP